MKEEKFNPRPWCISDSWNGIVPTFKEWTNELDRLMEEEQMKIDIDKLQKKLLTLNDIEEIIRFDCDGEFEYQYDKKWDEYTYDIVIPATMEYIKQNAEKWIEYFNGLGDYFKESNPERSSRHYAQAIALRMFFNLDVT